MNKIYSLFSDVLIMNKLDDQFLDFWIMNIKVSMPSNFELWREKMNNKTIEFFKKKISNRKRTKKRIKRKKWEEYFLDRHLLYLHTYLKQLASQPIYLRTYLVTLTISLHPHLPTYPNKLLTYLAT
jgi:hypothetical protein